MEDQVEHTPTEESKQPSGVKLQLMDDFMKETEPEEFDREASGVPRRPEQPPTKKQKRNVDADALAAEEEAVKAMGDTNWIGKLNGEYILVTKSL
jgi:hypothetical protein